MIGGPNTLSLEQSVRHAQLTVDSLFMTVERHVYIQPSPPAY